MGKTIELKIEFIAELHAIAQASLYTRISGKHLCSLDYMCKRLADIEKSIETIDEYNKIDEREHTALAHAAVILSACLLEAEINKFYCDATFSPRNLKEISDEKISLVKEKWGKKASRRRIQRTARYSMLEKYDLALTLLGCQKFNKSHVISHISHVVKSHHDFLSLPFRSII